MYSRWLLYQQASIRWNKGFQLPGDITLFVIFVINLAISFAERCPFPAAITGTQPAFLSSTMRRLYLDLIAVLSVFLMPGYLSASEYEGFVRHPITFPCNLDGFSRKPPIIFVGERHDDPKDIDRRDSLKETAAQGMIYLATEGTVYESRKVRTLFKDHKVRAQLASFFGLESESVWDLVNLTSLYIEHLEGRRLQWENFFPQLVFARSVRNVWPMISRPLADASEEQHAVYWQQFYSMPWEQMLNLSARFSQLTGQYFSSTIWKDKAAFLRLTRRVLGEFANEMEKSLLVSGEPFPSFNILRQAMDHPLNDKLQNQFGFQFTLAWRDQVFAQNLAKAYCEIASQQKPLVVALGFLHLLYPPSMLDNASQGRIPILVQLRGKWIGKEEISAHVIAEQLEKTKEMMMQAGHPIPMAKPKRLGQLMVAESNVPAGRARLMLLADHHADKAWGR
ncbi:MAG: hypothetical protein HY537_00080, partial [Deltaproteobacteria bacterium]|nr:hypothetical protein [Deltaproteobacteria bacterium]